MPRAVVRVQLVQISSRLHPLLGGDPEGGREDTVLAGEGDTLDRVEQYGEDEQTHPGGSSPSCFLAAGGGLKREGVGSGVGGGVKTLE